MQITCENNIEVRIYTFRKPYIFMSKYSDNKLYFYLRKLTKHLLLDS